MRNDTSRNNPILFRGLLHIPVAEPHIPEFNLPRGEVIRLASARDSIVIGSSNSLTIRSEAAIAELQNIDFSLKS